MESLPISPVLTFTGPAWPARLGGAVIFISTLGVFIFFPIIPVFVPIISFALMLIAVFLSAKVTITADPISRTLTILKKRIIGTSHIAYRYDDIVCLRQNISTTTDGKGISHEKHEYTIAIKGDTSTRYEGGYRPIPITIPTSAFATLSTTVKHMQLYTRARAIADAVGVPLYAKGSANDDLVRLKENLPGYVDALGKLPDALKEAKKENDRVASEILGDRPGT
jgi:hypothetical protein